MVKRVSTSGINPYHQDERAIRRILCGELLMQLGDVRPDRVVFYGSGCREEKVPMMASLLKNVFDNVADVEVNGDLIGAARAVLGVEEGIACILGTGSNSCLYDGHRIVANIPPLGYILGEEGSGAVLGKMFINEMLKNSSLHHVCDEFFSLSRLSESDIIERVYRQPQANKFLASIAPFVHEHLDNAAVRAVVIENFRQFFLKNVKRYRRPDLACGFVGSMAWHFKAELCEAANIEGVSVGRVVKSPMEGLVEYQLASQ